MPVAAFIQPCAVSVRLQGRWVAFIFARPSMAADDETNIRRIDDFKHQAHVSVNLTDREFRDAAIEADRLDKKTSELIRYALRRYLYGTVGLVDHDGKSNRNSE